MRRPNVCVLEHNKDKEQVSNSKFIPQKFKSILSYPKNPKKKI